MAIIEARQYLMRLVYTAPLPESAFNEEWGWTPSKYLALRRLGQVWKAIGKDTPTKTMAGWTGTVFVNRDDFFGAYYYAWTLNFGSQNVGRYGGGHYIARPFWTLMVRVMRLRYRELGATEGLVALKKAATIVGYSNTAFIDTLGQTRPGVAETLAVAGDAGL
jgi:hypothetical protein